MTAVRGLTVELRSFTNEANVKIAAKFVEMDKALGELKKQTASGGYNSPDPPQQLPQAPE